MSASTNSMKLLLLLFVVGIVFIAHGIMETDDYSLSIQGPPPKDGLPQLSYGGPDHLLVARSEILESPLPERSLTYKFHLPSGIYDHLRWAGHGVPIPARLSFQDWRGHEVVAVKTGTASDDELLDSTSEPLCLPHARFFAVPLWLLENGWSWAFTVFLFFALRVPIAALILRLTESPAIHFRWGLINLKAFLLMIVTLTAVWLCFAVPGAIRFDVGDDPAMEMLSSGYVTGHSSEYLIFMNVLIGLLLKSLYLLSPQVPWYPFLLMTVVIVSLAGCTLLLLQKDQSDRFCWLCLFGAVFGSYFVTHLQFTSAAYLAGLFGMLIFSQRTSRVSMLTAVFMVTTASLIRFESFLLLLVTTAAAAWLLSQRRTHEKILFFVAVLFLAWAGKTFDQAYYDRQPDWQAYREYNHYRGDLSATSKLSDSDANRPIYERVGWSENDYKMFNIHWLYEDAAAFSAEKLAYLDHHLPASRSAKSTFFTILLAISFAQAPFLLFLAILFGGGDKPTRSFLVWVAIVGPALFVIIFLAVTSRLPARVFVPVLFEAALFLLVSARRDGETARCLAATLPLPLTFVTLAVLSIHSVWVHAVQNRTQEERIIASLKFLAPYTDKTFVSSINAVLLERLNPWTGLAETRNVNIIHLMWSGGSPSFELQLRRHGSASLFQSIASDRNYWLLVPTSQWDRADSFSLYMDEHYHQKIKMTPVLLSDGLPAVFPDFAVMQAAPEGPH
jgi:hypothetical protein